MRAYLAFVPHFCLVVSISAVPARACAPAWPRGERVRIATESALIVWDEQTKTQHFIRRASFETRLPYFGFLVPTPTQPQLAEAPDDLFQHLEQWTKPETKTELVFEEVPIGCGLGSARKKSEGVTVLARQHVAGYDAAVLKADEAKALQNWLEKHGYDARPQLTDWLEPYIKAGWIITAFQIAKTDKEQDGLSTQAVRMSFQADKPFFPYREPTDLYQNAKPAERLLRLFVLSGQRMQAQLGEAEKQWPGQAVWANPLATDQRQTIAGLLDRQQIPVPEGTWLTVFDDSSSQRPGNADLFFSPSPDQSRLQRKPIHEYRVVPWTGTCGFSCFLILAGPAGLWLLVRWRKHRKAASA